MFGCQIGAVPERAGGPARLADRHDGAVSVAGSKVSAQQVGQAVSLRAAHVRHQAGGFVKRELGKPGRHLTGVDRATQVVGVFRRELTDF